MKKQIKSQGYSDTRLIQREVWNGYTDFKGRQIENKFSLKFTRIKAHDKYVIAQKGMNMLGPEELIVKPGEWGYIPHGFYILEGVKLPHGEEISVTWNYEKSMFKGNKIPSNTYGFDE